MSDPIFDSHRTPVKCPGCGHEFSEKLGVLRKSPNLSCPGCGKTIKIAAAGVDKALTACQRTLDDLFRKASKL
jgi:ribosomal protein S27E